MAISLASLRRGGDARPPRLLTYGVAGVGKTFADGRTDATGAAGDERDATVHWTPPGGS